MYRVTLTDAQRQELNRRTHQPGLAPATRDRLEMLRLSDAGLSVPKIAISLGQHEQTVRRWLKVYLTAGFDALANKPRGGKTARFTPALLDSVCAEIAKGERTWNAGQVAAWLSEQHGLAISATQVRLHLRRAGLSYKRTSRTLRHKQNRAEVESKAAMLATLKKGELPD